MSTAQRAEREPGTEVQLASSVAVGALPPEFQQALEMRKLQNQVAGQLASLNWGKQLDLLTRRAIADWGQQFRVDVTTEIHVLGGNVYLNAAFAMRHLSEMIAAGLIEYAYADHVEHDPRLSRLGPEGEGEMSRRLRERIMHAIPDNAASAVVFRVKMRSMDKEVVGVKWCGGGTRKSDPVGEAFPVETSESRAARRCMRLLASHVPRQKAEELEQIDNAAQLLGERIQHARKEISAREARVAAPPAGRSLMPASQAPLAEPGNPYSDIDETKVPVGVPTERQEAPTRVAPPRSAEQRATAQHVAASATDPYDDAPEASTSSSATDESSEPKPVGHSRFVMTFGGEFVGKEMRFVPTDDLARLLNWAMKQSKGNHAAFIEAATVELEERRLDAEEAAASAEG